MALPSFVRSQRQAGDQHSLALKKGGRVIAWGCRGGGDDDGQCDVPDATAKWATAISAGVVDSFALSDPCQVPKVSGFRLASARLALGKRHCRVGRVSYAFSRKKKRGIVISQSLRPGRVVPANSKVNLVVSRGRRR